MFRLALLAFAILALVCPAFADCPGGNCAVSFSRSRPVRSVLVARQHESVAGCSSGSCASRGRGFFGRIFRR